MLRTIDGNSKQLYFLLLSGLFIFNVLLKISFLDSQPFWYDEIVSVKATLLDFGHIKHISEWDNNPPFYYYCLWVWAKLFGISEFKIRLLSVLFNSTSACLLFHFAKKHIGLLAGICASVLFSLHGFSYEYSHEARCYSLVVMLVLLSSVCFFNFLQKRTYWPVFWLGLVNFLIIYTHYIAGLVLLSQLILILINKKELLKKFGASILLLLIFVAFRFTKKQILIMLAFNKEGKTFWLQTSDLTLLKEALSQFFFGDGIWILFLLVFLISIVVLFNSRKKNTAEKNLFLTYSILLSIGCIAVTFLVGLYKPIFLARYLLFTVPFIIILISYFLTAHDKWIAWISLPLFALTVFNIDLDPQKPMDFKLASMVVKSLQESNKPIVLIQTKDVTALFAYYYNLSYFEDYKNLQGDLKGEKIFELENKSDLADLPLAGENTIVFCQTFEKESDSNQIFDIFKQNNFVFKTTKEVKGVKISLLRKI
jgi:uncharacterized membrane protein